MACADRRLYCVATIQAGAMLVAKRIRLPSPFSSHGGPSRWSVFGSDDSQRLKFMRPREGLGNVERRNPEKPFNV